MASSSSSIAIIGAGSVGSAIAQTLLLRRLVADIILVDLKTELCQAQVQDLSDATYLHNVRIRQGSHADASQADVIIISAGAKQRPDDTRIDLIDRNFKVLESIIGAMKPIRSDAVLVLVANPVDILTYFAQQLSGLPESQVLGSGTLLDSTRLRGTLARKLDASHSDCTRISFAFGTDLRDRLRIPQSARMWLVNTETPKSYVNPFFRVL